MATEVYVVTLKINYIIDNENGSNSLSSTVGYFIFEDEADFYRHQKHRFATAVGSCNKWLKYLFPKEITFTYGCPHLQAILGYLQNDLNTFPIADMIRVPQFHDYV